ncbi:MAG: DUF2911 domain-containing protein [Acidobacteriaceae bacterium]
MRNPARCTTVALALAFAATLGVSTPASAQMAGMKMHTKSSKPLASPAAMTDVSLDGAHITIHYNSPRMRGRKIMGALVPYGKPWRTGANPATSFVTTGNLKIGDLTVPAGSYTLDTLPAAPGTPWLFIVSKKTGEWGIPYPEGDDLGRTPMQYAQMSAPQEDMTISFEHTKKHSTELHVKWETTDVSVKIEAVK